MEKIQFGDEEILYPIKSIQPVAVHIMRIIFDGNTPGADTFGKPITIYTQGGIKECTLEGWDTVYYMDSENQTVYLSDDGSIYTEPEPSEPEPDTEPEPYEPTIEELQSYKISAMQSASESTIKAGVDVNGEHFSLSNEAQMALIIRQFEIDNGMDYIDFYPDGEPSKYYSADEMQEIIDTADDFINYHEVYCNELCLWIKTLTDKDEIEAVYYGIDIPEEHRSSVLSDLIFHSKDELHDEEEDKDDDDTGGDEPDDDDDDNKDAGGKLGDLNNDPADDNEPADEPDPADDGEGEE